MRLKFGAALAVAGELPDSPAGWTTYADYLDWQATEGPLGAAKASELMSRGWAIGSDVFKGRLVEDHKVASFSRAWAFEGVAEIRHRQWTQALAPLLAKVSIHEQRDQRKSAPWRVKIAAEMKATTSVSNRWLAKRLEMGSPFYVSKHVGLFKKFKGNA